MITNVKAFVYGERTVLEIDNNARCMAVHDEHGDLVPFEREGRYCLLARKLDSFSALINNRTVSFSPLSNSEQPLPEDEKPCNLISAFELKGNQSSELQGALQAAIRKSDPPRTRLANGQSGRCLGTKGTSIVMDRVQNAILEQGSKARVIAEAQDLRSGVFVMTLVPPEAQRSSTLPARRTTNPSDL